MNKFIFCVVTMVKRLYKFPEILFFQEGPGVRNHQYTTSGVKLLNVSNLRNGKIDLTTSDRYISENEAFNKYSHFLCDPNDFIIASSGIKIDSFNSKMGFIHQSDLPVCMNTSTIRFKVLNKEVLEIRYFMYYLKSIVFKKVLTKVVTGSAQLNFGPSHLKNMSISLPNLDIQKNIVQRLDRVNKLIEIKRKLLFQLDELVKSRFVEMFGVFNINPNNYNTIKFRDLIEQNNINEEDRVWLLNLDMIKPNTGEIVEKVYINRQNIPTSSISFKKGTVLYSKLRPYLNKVVIADENGYGTSELIPLNSYKNGLTAEYLAYYLRQDSFVEYIKDKVTGAKMPRVAMDILRNIDIIQPNYIYQEQFSSFVNHVIKLKSDVQKSIDETQLLMDSLMQEYFG